MYVNHMYMLRHKITRHCSAYNPAVKWSSRNVIHLRAEGERNVYIFDFFEDPGLINSCLSIYLLCF